MKIGIYANLTRDKDGKIAYAIYELLKNKGVDVYLSDELRAYVSDGVFLSRNELAKNADIVVVLGGDGTILRIAKECAKNNALIFAINLGNKGFLTATENVELNAKFDDILNGNYAVDARAFLAVSCKGKSFCALNEVVLARGTRTKVMKAQVKVNGSLVDKYTADGVIIATPTGSTAYSLSAGGPIIVPGVEAFVITPISAHSLHSRPIVVSNSVTITGEVLHAEPNAHLNIDGEDVLNLQENDVITVKKSDLCLKFIRLAGYDYYEIQLEKMRYWSSFDKE